MAVLQLELREGPLPCRTRTWEKTRGRGGRVLSEFGMPSDLVASGEWASVDIMFSFPSPIVFS